mmetsp:Transcript_37978/g.96043  ORF Transcript_37978/g.96043 Transcript_37978/m.96043 type:complete len:378 (-) Transcript_37978:705-1838(-)
MAPTSAASAMQQIRCCMAHAATYPPWTQSPTDPLVIKEQAAPLIHFLPVLTLSYTGRPCSRRVRLTTVAGHARREAAQQPAAAPARYLWPCLWHGSGLLQPWCRRRSRRGQLTVLGGGGHWRGCCRVGTCQPGSTSPATTILGCCSLVLTITTTSGTLPRLLSQHCQGPRAHPTTHKHGQRLAVPCAGGARARPLQRVVERPAQRPRVQAGGRQSGGGGRVARGGQQVGERGVHGRGGLPAQVQAHLVAGGQAAAARARPPLHSSSGHSGQRNSCLAWQVHLPAALRGLARRRRGHRGHGSGCGGIRRSGPRARKRGLGAAHDHGRVRCVSRRYAQAADARPRAAQRPAGAPCLVRGRGGRPRARHGRRPGAKVRRA